MHISWHCWYVYIFGRITLHQERSYSAIADMAAVAAVSSFDAAGQNTARQMLLRNTASIDMGWRVHCCNTGIPVNDPILDSSLRCHRATQKISIWHAASLIPEKDGRLLYHSETGSVLRKAFGWQITNQQQRLQPRRSESDENYLVVIIVCNVAAAIYILFSRVNSVV